LCQPGSCDNLFCVLTPGVLTFLFLDLHANVVINGEHGQIRDQVESAHSHEYVWVIEWDLFRYLHPAPYQQRDTSSINLVLDLHPKDDDKVRATTC